MNILTAAVLGGFAGALLVTLIEIVAFLILRRRGAIHVVLP